MNRSSVVPLRMSFAIEDNTRAFENDLTNVLGDMIDYLLRTSAIPQESKQTKKKWVIEWLKKKF